MKQIKVFGIGLGKTGTSTLMECLEILGYKVHDGDISLIEPYKKHNMDIFYNLVDKYDAFEDEPWSLLYRELDRKYPNSKFILTVRNDGQSWVNSLLNFMFLSGLRGRANIMYYNKECFGYSSPIKSEDKFIEFYNNHNKNVIEYFKNKPNNFIIINWKQDGWDKLCKFLDEPIPNVPIPHAKKGDYSKFSLDKSKAEKNIRRYFPEELIDYRDGGLKGKKHD